MVEFTAAAIVTRFKTASVTATSSVFRRVAGAAAMIALSGFGVAAQAQVATSTNGAKLHHIAATGGPMIAANTEEATADLRADAQFRTLFQTWKKLDATQQGVIAIPSVQPVHSLSFTSNFGIRSDPFRGTAAMHAGVDIPGPVGTPIYATADGIIAHAGRQGGYGNMVEISHGKGIATRYGHLSKILVADNARVTRGQLIALMGSTGRSTGPHLHYEVRIDGHAVNPIPFLTTADYLLAAQDRSVNAIPVSTGGPAAQD
ncbi:M23 family metallopeptidase [Sphingomonas sp. PP-CC-3A-396]|uniref:M23 family metallopeptidase n=1 Tax=Sphingomonas sp. PP-CC-3A-396 TaxID=2135655 RepID=UPI0010E2B488|nr:M23 family metallopeptidase [Sphingomonas sp. PP-CC-3A-396]TCQ09559.1 peptidase M23-like protein [Sphingomonas sp. PP-CC-3A-396]